MTETITTHPAVVSRERLLEFADTRTDPGVRAAIIDLAGKWKHGYIPLDAVAWAIKTKQSSGDGKRRKGIGDQSHLAPFRADASRGKSRGDARAQVASQLSRAGGARRKGAPRPAGPAAPSSPTNTTDVSARAAEAVRLKAPELKARAAAGDKVAAKELERRAAKRTGKAGDAAKIAELEQRYGSSSDRSTKYAAASELAQRYEAAGKATQAANWKRAAGKHAPEFVGRNAAQPDAPARAAENLKSVSDAQLHAMLGDRQYASWRDAVHKEMTRRNNAVATGGTGHMPESATAAGDALEQGKISVRSASPAAVAEAQRRAAADTTPPATVGGHTQVNPSGPAAAGAPSPVPAAAAKTRKPSALHAEFRELKRQQDLRLESATRGALIGHNGKDSEEVRRYFGEGEFQGQGTEPRLTYSTFLAQRRSGKAHERQQQAAYDAGVKLGRKHSGETSSAQHDAEFEQHGKGHDAGMFSGGYNDGMIAGEAAKSKRAEAATVRGNVKAYTSARSRADKATQTANGFDAPANQGNLQVAARHKSAAGAHAEAGRLALAAGDRNAAQHHLAVAENHLGKAKAHEANAAKRAAERPATRPATGQVGPDTSQGHPSRIDAGTMRATKDNADPSSTAYTVRDTATGIKQGHLHMTPNADANGNRWVVTNMPTQDSASKHPTAAAALHDHAVRTHAHREGGIYPHGAPTSTFTAKHQAELNRRLDAEATPQPSPRSVRDAYRAHLAGMNDQQLEDHRQGLYARGIGGRGSSMSAETSPMHQEVAREQRRRGIASGQARADAISRRQGRAESRARAAAPPSLLAGRSGDYNAIAAFNQPRKGTGAPEVIGTLSHHDEIVTIHKTNGKHRVKVDGRQHGPGHDTRAAALAEAHTLVPEHRRARTEAEAIAQAKAIGAKAEADRKAAVAARQADPAAARKAAGVLNGDPGREMHPHGLKPGDKVIAHNVGVSGDTQGTYHGIDINGHPTVTLPGQGQGRPISVRDNQIRPTAAPLPGGPVRLERNQTINLRTGKVTEGHSSATAGSAVDARQGSPVASLDQARQARAEQTPRQIHERLQQNPSSVSMDELQRLSGLGGRFAPAAHAEIARRDAATMAARGQQRWENGPPIPGTSRANASPVATPDTSGSAAATGDHLRVEHSGDGTVVYGTSRDDKQAIDALKGQGFKWSRSLGGWYLPRTWNHSTRDVRVRGLQSRLGDRVHVEHGSVARSGTGADRAQAQIDRAKEVADQQRARAERFRAESAAQDAAARRISDHIPFGQPILVGHHSEGRHRRDLARIESNSRKSIASHQAAQEAEGRARSAEARARMQTDPRAAARRLQRSEAELRSVQRKLHGTGKEIHGEHTPASGEYADRLRAREQELTQQIGHDRGIAGVQLDRFGRHNIAPGDVVAIGNRQHVVHSVGPKNAKLMTEVGPLPYAYTQVTAVGKLDEMSTDALKRTLARAQQSQGNRRLPPAIVSRIEGILRARGDG